jgi:tetratricopeptide (TPR) repeat protein
MTALRRFWFSLRRSLKSWNRALAASLRGCGRLGIRLFHAAWGWGRTRSWRYLVQGLPALLALAVMLVVLARWMSLPAHEVAARYQERASAAAKSQDFATARVCYERLAANGRDRPENLYELGLALAAQGQPERAFEIMEQIAPIDRKAHAPAHLWLAIYYWKNLSDPKNRKRAEEHLELALQGDLPDPDAAHGLLGELHAQNGSLDKAAIHLEHAVRTRPHVRLRYAVVLAAQGKKALATDEAKQVASYFKTRAQADVKDHVARVGWAETLAFLEDFPQALQVLADGHHLTGEPLYPPVMGRVVAKWHHFVVASKPDDTATQWTLLEKGLQLDSTNVDLLDRLVQLMGRTEEEAAKARVLINKVLSKGEATATTHFLLGMDAWRQDDAAAAELHWERAIQLSPNLPMVANNLAWLLAHNKNPDLPRALDLSTRVIEKYPNDLSYRDTRARIYMKMARWRDALPDLELILARAPTFPGINRALAEAYGHLDRHQLAAEHRHMAEVSEKKRKAPKN